MTATPPAPPPKPSLDARREHERGKYVALAARPAAPGTGYGATNHGHAAIPLILKLKPRFIADFGCGRNDFIGELRRLGTDGLGIDFAFPEADVPRAMHKTGLLDRVADVVTSFDALEHLLPEDVDAVLAEMRRIARPRGHFIFSICIRPSKTTVAGEGLHPTVRTLAWWLERIGHVGKVTAPKAEGRYIVGRFNVAGGCGCA